MVMSLLYGKLACRMASMIGSDLTKPSSPQIRSSCTSFRYQPRECPYHSLREDTPTSETDFWCQCISYFATSSNSPPPGMGTGKGESARVINAFKKIHEPPSPCQLKPSKPCWSPDLQSRTAFRLTAAYTFPPSRYLGRSIPKKLFNRSIFLRGL